MSDEIFEYEHQEPRNNLIAFLLISSCVFVVAVCGFLAWLFSVVRDTEVNRKLNQANYVELQDLRKKQDEKLNTYQYMDKEKGIVRIPVERAMQMMVEEAKTAAPKVEASPAAAKSEASPTAKPEAAKPAAAAGQKK